MPLTPQCVTTRTIIPRVSGGIFPCFRSTYRIQALLASPDETSSAGDKPSSGAGGGYEEGPSFDVASITPPETGRPVTVPVNCGAKDGMANVVSTVETASLPSHTSSRVEEERVDTRFSGCNLRCIVQVPREEVRSFCFVVWVIPGKKTD